MLEGMFRREYYQEAKVHFIATHQHPVNIALHHASNFLVFAAIPLLFVNWVVSAVFIALTQILTIGGHLFFEKNKPAFVGYNNFVIIVSSLSWSLDNWFGLRQQNPEVG